MKKKCDICKKPEDKEQPFVRIFRETIKTYQPTKDDPFHIKQVTRTKQVWVCSECFLVKVKGKKLMQAMVDEPAR